MLKIGSKRRRNTAELVEDNVAAAMREQISEELKRETVSLKKQLIDTEKEAINNRNAAEILTKFIHDGQAEVNDQGEVRLLPNQIKNEESEMF